MTKAYEKYELDSKNDNEIKDMLFNESSLLQFNLKTHSSDDQSSSRDEIDLQHLLCDEELIFDEIPLK